ncbi:MAG: hypothetical protein ACYCWE_13290 [Eubacteriales bacterium]
MNDNYPSVTLYDLEKYHNFKYNFKNIPCFDKGIIFLINEINCSEAEADIMLLSDIFIAAHKNEPLFPITRIYTDDIRFEASDAFDPQQFCHFELYDKTTEDNTDYVLILHFYITPDPRNIIYGDIYYLSDGSIGKYNTVFEHENDVFFVNCKKHGSRLEVQRVIYEKGKRKKRFYPFIKIGMRAAYFISGMLVIVTVSLIMTAFYIYDNIKLKNDSVVVIKTDSVNITSISEPQTVDTVITTGNKAELPKTETITEIENITLVPDTILQSETVLPEPESEIIVNTNRLSLISITSPVTLGNTASIKIQGCPDTVYDISVHYSSGISSASGLEDKTSDSSGYIEWSWKIGNRTKTGTYKVEIKGGDETFTTDIMITE